MPEFQVLVFTRTIRNALPYTGHNGGQYARSDVDYYPVPRPTKPTAADGNHRQ